VIQGLHTLGHLEVSSEPENQSNLNKNALWKHWIFLSIPGQEGILFQTLSRFVMDCVEPGDRARTFPTPAAAPRPLTSAIIWRNPKRLTAYAVIRAALASVYAAIENALATAGEKKGMGATAHWPG
jgi:hypothetical protein